MELKAFELVRSCVIKIIHYPFTDHLSFMIHQVKHFAYIGWACYMKKKYINFHIKVILSGRRLSN